MEPGSSEEDGREKRDKVGNGHKSAKNSDVTPEDQHQREVDQLFCRLNLEDNCQNKLKNADFLKIIPSIKKHDEITEKDVAHAFLELDHRARYIPVTVDSTVDNHSATTKVADEIDTDVVCANCDDLFSSTVDTVQSMKQSHVHPMDVQMAVFHCSDSFLRQNMITKLSQCQYALPLLVPDPFTKDIECPLWTFRDIRKAWKVKDKSGAITSKNMPICQAKTHMVSFSRLGAVTSKSLLMNTIINDRHSTFFHRNCPGATKSHCLVDGMAEIAWYCPNGKDNDAFSDCVAFCNLHGDAVSHKKQREILINNASVNVVLVPTLGKDDKGREILSDLLKGPKPLICLMADDVSPVATKIGPGKYKMGLKDRSQSDVAAELKKMLGTLLSTPSFQLESMASVSEIRIDEDDPNCQRGYSAALQILDLLKTKKRSKTDIKDTFLPCQGKLWHEWCRIKKDLYRLRRDKMEQEKCEKEKEMEQKRSEQRKSSSELMKLFIETLESLKGDGKRFFLKWIGILLDNFFTNELSEINQAYDAKWSEVVALKNSHDKSDQLKGKQQHLLNKSDKLSNQSDQLKEKQNELEKLSKQLQSATVGFEHIMREIGQMYEAHKSPKKTGTWSQHPKLAAELMIAGHPTELMDGDAAHVPLTWITSVLDEVILKLGDKRVFVLSVLGIQSSGKSTMLNAMFGLEFAVSAGRCTRGAFMQLVKVSEEKQEAFKFDYVLVVDTEGLRALELAGTDTYHHDNELATFVIGLANMTLINIFGENTSEMQDVLHIAVQAFMRMKQVQISPNCLFVHQNVTDIEAGDKNKVGKRRLQNVLDEMTRLAAEEEVFDAKCFSDVIEFNVDTDVKYFSQLWEGSPPMAPPNPGYSENIQDLKDTILSKASQSHGISLSEFKSKIKDLWNALLKENFVFNFKNTREISLHRTLEEEYGNWTWALREAMLIIENELQTRIHNGTTIDKIKNQLVNQMENTRKEVDGKMKNHFEDVKIKDVVGQWKAHFEKKIKQFYDELVGGAEQKLKEIIQQKNAQRKLDEKQTEFENKLLQKSKDLACTLKDKEKDEKTHEVAFNALWKELFDKFTADLPPRNKIKIQEDVDIVLFSNGIEYSLIDERRRLDKYKDILCQRDYSGYVIRKVNRKGLYSKIFDKDPLPCAQAVKFICNVVDQAITLMESKPVSTRGYDISYVHAMAKEVMKQVKDFDSDKPFALKPGFKVDILLYVFQTAEKWLSKCHKEFQESIDPRTYLENKKEQYSNVFKGYCKGSSSATVLGSLLCSKLKESVTQAVYDKTALNVAGNMKRSLPPFSGNRTDLEIHVLRSLAEQEDFDSYMNYISRPKNHLEQFIKETVEGYISTNENNIRSIMQNHVAGLCQLLNQAVVKATKKVTTENGDTDMWLEEFSSMLNDYLRFDDTNCYGNFNDINQENFDFLNVEILKGLDSMKEYLNSIPIDMKNVREKPDEILIKQLCKCCWVQCPFCGAICTNTLEDHPEDHSVRFHRSSGIHGMHMKDKPILAVTFCTTKVASDRTFYRSSDDQAFPYKEYRKAGPKYENWTITPEESKLAYWKWFVCQFQEKLEEHYEAEFKDSEEIPKEWRNIDKVEAIDSLEEM